MAPIGAIMCTSSNARKSSNPKCNKIQCIKIVKKRPCDLELLLWTSTKDWMKRVGKLIGASVTRAYKNAHLSIGMVCKWEMGQMEWQEIQKNKWYRFESVDWMIWLRWNYRRWWKACKEQSAVKEETGDDRPNPLRWQS